MPKWRKPLGVTCSGCLDFALQLSLDPTSSASTFGVILSRFAGYATDAGYVDGTGYAPSFVSRGPLGGGVGFNLIRNMSALLPGNSTAFLVVATNATAYDNRGGAMLASFVFTDQSNLKGQINGLFAPTFIPEPSSVLLLSLGLIGFATLRTRFR